MRTSGRHSDHDRLVSAIRGWYTRSYPEMGYLVEERPFGYYSRNLQAVYYGGRVTVGRVSAGQVPEFLSDLRRYYGAGDVTVWVDNRQVDAEVGPALLAGGCTRGNAEIFLAHVGPVPSAPPVADLTVEPVTPTNLREFVVTKRKGFGGIETEPAPQEIEAELALRRAEMAGDGRFLLARIGGEPAGTLGWYEGDDRLIFLVATRVPFRRRGIATWLLCRVLAESRYLFR